MKKVCVAVENPFMSKSRCWHCAESVNAPLCGQCGKIQPPSTEDFFVALGMSSTFYIDLKSLEEKYLQLQQKIHPDLFVDKSSREKLYAGQQARFFNQAYETLKDPIKRGYYLLSLNEYESDDGNGKTISDPQLLALVLEEQEALEENGNLDQIKEWIAQGQEKVTQCELDLQEAFQKKDYSLALRCLRYFKYQQKFIEKATEKISRCC
jgi:molecular chaperone HscB